MVDVGDGSSGSVKLMRNHRPQFLYRGQNRHFDPCWPSICRDLSENTYLLSELAPSDQVRILRGLALNNWFRDELAKHPMIRWTRDQRIILDVAAIAQHYGIPTGYFDASESFEVSAFFATCRFVSASSSWEPVTDGEGVMYRLQLDAVEERATAICYQPFPRPSQQWAWTVELRLGEDFLQAPMLQGFTFEHDAKVGEKFLQRFGGGTNLLPPDPTARLAKAMCLAQEIPIGNIEEAEAQLAEDASGISAVEVKELRALMQEQLGISLCQRSAVAFTQDELEVAEDGWSKNSHEFYRGVGFTLVRTSADANEV
jgi:hypothetical protein